MSSPTDVAVYVSLDRAHSSLLAKGRIADANELFDYLDTELLGMDAELLELVVPYLTEVIAFTVGEA